MLVCCRPGRAKAKEQILLRLFFCSSVILFVVVALAPRPSSCARMRGEWEGTLCAYAGMRCRANEFVDLAGTLSHPFIGVSHGSAPRPSEVELDLGS